jgi:predicted RNase H-like nuclease (RuvC/YqgF family)
MKIMVNQGDNVYQDIKALQSSILVLRQKLQYLVHNEKILGRNILILNKKIANNSSSEGNSSIASNEKIEELISKIDSLDSRIKGIESTLEMFSKRFAKQEDLKEMKYVIDNINPLEYTTVEQVKKIIKEEK